TEHLSVSVKKGRRASCKVHNRAKPMTATRNVSGLQRGWAWMRENRREGARQRAIRRLLIAADGEPITTRQMMEAVFPRRNFRGAQPDWLWACVRRSALRYASPILSPRSRPLRWRA